MLPARPDRSEIYYKMTNEEENHHGLQYGDGLNIDPIEFNSDPQESCVKGRIYFTTKEHLHEFFDYGYWIRPTTIPKDAKVVLDPDGNKYGADRLFFHKRETMDFYFEKLFDKKTFPEYDYGILALYCQDYFHKWFDKEIFPAYKYWDLAISHTEKFHDWFDKDLFPKEDYVYLENYCSKYKKIWAGSYLTRVKNFLTDAIERLLRK